ncbi:MAG: copper homeostasis protein CutC [Clostridiaceae bacterium]|nr:copper homeostasis protein CutC [Clostridiaceae bacterium]
MKKYRLEACVDSVESACQAAEGGADRLELCSNLIIGGTTPSPALFNRIRELMDIKINVLIRPRYGDFLYTDHEFEIICSEIKAFRELGADGIVAGCLTADGFLDIGRMNRMRELAGGMDLTLHRAFDMCRDPFKTLHQAVEAGVNTILTSGQKNTCMEGKELIKELVGISEEKIDILVGGGVNADVIRALIPETGASSFHMSGKVILDSGMEYRKEGVSMGIPGIGEYERFRTDKEAIRKAKAVLRCADMADCAGPAGAETK